MSDENHTPAPWAWNKQGNRLFQETGNPTGQIAICDIVRTPSYKANARLIAKAPELLDILKELIEPYSATDEMLSNGLVCNLSEKQQKAIVKARRILSDI
ncbi:MAG: hypothetical protein CBC71_06245 [Rhodobacteraceae bacterium TMED111]|nr:hypothetical protein [Marinovum sp.]OUV41099.1 MAG: hypothetical protein CBC71_06245 [Rhodobacteraceae bacterium TMED111]|tara:strand:- start:18286 stop:18585 length:300 start_codon:yes stop_codon:yes gene_type:complete